MILDFTVNFLISKICEFCQLQYVYNQNICWHILLELHNRPEMVKDI